jgi:hypothetical protein
MATDPTSELARPRGPLWLAAVNGDIVPRMGGQAANGESQRQLTDAEAEDQIIATLAEYEDRLDPASDFRLDVVTLRAELEQRRAQRRP